MSEGFKSATIAQDHLLPGIHGLRGLAALAVVLYHVVHLTGIATPDSFAFIGRDFGYGPHLFFILSAFSLMYSTERTMGRSNWIADYLTKRFFRIAPLFYCLIGVQLIRQAMVSGTLEDFSTLVLNFSFTFGFVPWSGIVWAGWTVGVEMIFYVLFPLLIMLVKTPRQALAVLVVAIAIGCASRYQFTLQYLDSQPRPRWDWGGFTFVGNLYFFAAGLFVFRLAKTVEAHGTAIRLVVPAISLALLAGLMFSEWDRSLKAPGRLDLVLWMIALSGLCLWQSLRPNGMIANRFFDYLGERSYSIYLLHPVVIVPLKGTMVTLYGLLAPYVGAYAFFACAGLLTGIVLAAAEVTYRMVEVPGIKFGRRLIASKKPANGPATVTG
jgi:peptidoglycan/LPS O-acetylase OafA/YrhL